MMSADAPYDDEPVTGPCCNCLEITALRNVMFIHRRGPTPGRGWGCVVCNLPQDGAVALICDACARTLTDLPKFVCTGYMKDGERTPLDTLSPEPFDHDPEFHPEMRTFGMDGFR
ncbi:MAG TPA: hypothetical protein VEV38_11555 [Candidatus Eremiobacteraceae bacterium]|nr:hypothetical protein [Candidatus Eremiobacteraceae bacterium]